MFDSLWSRSFFKPIYPFPAFCGAGLQNYQRELALPPACPSCLPAGRSGREGKGRLGKIRKAKNRNKTLKSKRQAIFFATKFKLVPFFD